MTISITQQVDEMPKDLPQSDFGFDIEYKQEKGSAKRVFGATYRFIEACEECSQALVGSIGISIDPVIVLEDVEAGSIKTRFKIFYKTEGEEVIKSGDFWRIVCTYIIEGYKIIFNKTNQIDQEPQLRDIQSDLYQLSKEVEIENIGILNPVSDQDIIGIVEKFESIKDFLITGDKAEFLLSEEISVQIIQEIRVNIEKLQKEATRETLSHSDTSMILIVKKPDYLGDSQWVFRHGRKAILAKIEDKNWLKDFQERRKHVRPGDALKCKVRIENSYGYNNEMLYSKYFGTSIF
ncbi:MAG: hypothetical protein OXF08_04350 [Bacteroidetes bacterium]|nr:hypothetical protein [Bacteroidota bacterium]